MDSRWYWKSSGGSLMRICSGEAHMPTVPRAPKHCPLDRRARSRRDMDRRRAPDLRRFSGRQTVGESEVVGFWGVYDFLLGPRSAISS
jgi:hypothetical protein